MKTVLFCYQLQQGGEYIAVTSVLSHLPKVKTYRILPITEKEGSIIGPFSFIRKLLLSFLFWSKKFNDKQFAYVICTHYIQVLALIFSTHRAPYLFYYHGSKHFESSVLKLKHQHYSLQSHYAMILGKVIFHIEKYCILQAKTTIVPSLASRKYLNSIYHIKNNQRKILVIENGVDRKKFSCISIKEKNMLKNKFKIERNQKVFTYIGRLNELKGVELLLEAYSQLCAANPNVPLRLHLVHPNDYPNKIYKKSLTRLIKEEKIKNVYFYTSSFDKVQQYYQISDCIVLASQQETFSLVLLESLSCGVPVIGSNEGVMSELLSKIDDSMIVSKLTKEEIVKKISWILFLSKCEKNLIIQKARQAIKRYSWESTAVKFNYILEKELFTWAE